MNRSDWINKRPIPEITEGGICAGQTWIYSNPDNKRMKGEKFVILRFKHMNSKGHMVWNIKWEDNYFNNPHDGISQEDTEWINRNCEIYVN